MADDTAFVCITVCRGVGKRLYVWQCVEVWGNGCMYDSVWRCVETVVCMTVCGGVWKRLYVWQCVEVCGNGCALPSHPKLRRAQSFSWGALTNIPHSGQSYRHPETFLHLLPDPAVTSDHLQEKEERLRERRGGTEEGGSGKGGMECGWESEADGKRRGERETEISGWS